MHNCWPGEMESGVVCLFWLSGHPQQAPLLGTGRERYRRINGREEERLEMKKEWINEQGEIANPGKA